MGAAVLAPWGAALCAGPQALVCGLVAVAAVGITYMAVQAADDSASSSLSTSAVQTQACSNCQGPKCREHNDNIRELKKELAERELDLKIDKYDLFNKAYSRSAPMYRGTQRIGSWEGHIDQFRQKQASIRKEIASARKARCSIDTPDADRWGSKSPPSRPDRLYRK